MPLPVSFWAREDSGSAKNPSLNLTGADAVEITFVAETDTGDPGDLFLDQPAGGGVDPDTQVEIAGVSYSFTYELHGTLPTQSKHGAGQVPDQFEGSEVVVITVQDYPSAGETMRFAFMPNAQASQADMDAFGNGAISIQNIDETPPPSPVCFAAGTRLKTPGGETLVEDLRIGDLVVTADNGAQPIRWIGYSSFNWSRVPNKHKPILISCGALGLNLPRRDIVVSPQHKVLLRWPQVVELFGVPEVLAPAKGLAGLRGVRSMDGKRECVYFHIMLDKHVLLEASGLLSESFFPGATAMRMLSPRQRNEILHIFPSLENDPESGYGPRARRCLAVRETKRLATALRGNGKAGAIEQPRRSERPMVFSDTKAHRAGGMSGEAIQVTA